MSSFLNPYYKPAFFMIPRSNSFLIEDLIFKTYSDNYNRKFYQIINNKNGIVGFCDNKECALNQITKFHDELKVSK